MCLFYNNQENLKNRNSLMRGVVVSEFVKLKTWITNVEKH